MQTTGDTGGAAPRLAASGSDETGAVTVSVDESGAVTDVAVSTLPEALREAGRMTAAVDQALTQAYANGYPAAPPAPGEGLVAKRELRRPARGEFRALVEQSLGRHRPLQRSPRTLIGGETGVSRNECVTVVLDRTGPSGAATFDAGWLGQAREPNIAAALVEAFTAAYETRRNR